MHLPPITRASFLCTMGGLSCFQFLFNQAPNNNNNNINHPPLTSIYHEPLPGVDYSHNPSVFGRILNGDLPCRVYSESNSLLAFQDRTPKANFHALVIPKQYIKSVYSLTSNDVKLVQDMRKMGLDLLEKELPQALKDEDYILCYHIPPFNSVDHLHMHVLSPASEMNLLMRYGKYACGARWCTSSLNVIERLKSGKAAVPYSQLF
jgi:diadenosine tetraphosphate (Ap4A) HIT family hydrolase